VDPPRIRARATAPIEPDGDPALWRTRRLYRTRTRRVYDGSHRRHRRIGQDLAIVLSGGDARKHPGCRCLEVLGASGPQAGHRFAAPPAGNNCDDGSRGRTSLAADGIEVTVMEPKDNSRAVKD